MYEREIAGRIHNRKTGGERNPATGASTFRQMGIKMLMLVCESWNDLNESMEEH